MPKVAILDYGVGNLLSVERAFHFLGIPNIRTNDEKEISGATHLILPGVGAFGSAISGLKENGLDLVIKKFANSGKPLLGICLGMQLLFDKSHEFGLHEGLGLVPGEVKPISGNLDKTEKVPSIGWKNLVCNFESTINFDIKPSSFFYFVHSFMGVPENNSDLVASYYYADLTIPAIVRRRNVIGVQFHPEKSGKDGLELIRDFARL